MTAQDSELSNSPTMRVIKEKTDTFAFQAGAEGNEIGLLLESPGDEEIRQNKPLTGLTALNFECIRSVVNLQNNYQLAQELEKDKITIVNACNEHIDESKRLQILQKIHNGGCEAIVKDIAEKISHCTRLMCCGQIACEMMHRLKGRREFQSMKTIVYLPYFGDCGLGRIQIQSQDKRNKILYKLEMIGTFLSSVLKKDGYFGWNDMVQYWKEKTGESVSWRSGDGGNGPNWMFPREHKA